MIPNAVIYIGIDRIGMKIIIMKVREIEKEVGDGTAWRLTYK